MFKVLLLACLMAGSVSALAQDAKSAGPGVVTSIDSQGRELIVGQEIYILPAEVKLNGVLVSRSKVARLIGPGDEVSVDVENGRYVNEIHARLQ
ncbi:hypothetical protein DET50_11098 [Marinobacter pelagius]|uniref:DUF5666 domain-containing protein n=1 Tax=Marinobacter pelagius TaxID=379482 RepID=A0A366GQN1_9GAMM|nr:hypothetical protein DET50_11098 [Marinobacter pelagius]